MALIKQIKVGGETYDVGVEIGSGLRYNSGFELFLSGDTPLGFSPNGELMLKVGSGLIANRYDLSVLISGYDNGFANGLEYMGNAIALKIASGLKFDSLGRIAINLGTGLGINQDGELCVIG